MHAKSAAATQPDWFSRRISNIRRSDLKYVDHWAYDWSLKANGFNANGFVRPHPAAETREQRFFMRELDTRKPQRLNGDIGDVRYGLYHPKRFEIPVRAELHHPRINSHQL